MNYEITQSTICGIYNMYEYDVGHTLQQPFATSHSSKYWTLEFSILKRFFNFLFFNSSH